MALLAAVLIEVRRERVSDVILTVRAAITTYLVIVGSVYATRATPLIEPPS